MKNFKILQFMMLLSICGFMTSCQKDSLIESATPSQEFPAPLLISANDCLTECIDEASGNAYADYGSKTGSAGPNTKKVDYEIYNTPTTIEVRVTYNIIAGNSNAKADITVTVDGNVQTVLQVPKGTTVPFSFPLSAGWGACDLVSYSILQSGLSTPITFSGNYSLIGACPSCEDESFGYVTENNLDVTFTYNAAEPLQNAVVKFTFPQILSLHLNGNGQYEGPDGKLYSVNNPTNQTVFTWIGDIGCTASAAVSFQFSLSPDCSAPPANDHKANIWTDTTVNSVSVKGTNANIVYTGCP